MTFLEFTKTFGRNRIIDIRDVETFFGDIDRRRLYEWQKKGYLAKIANNYYILSDLPVNDEGLKTIATRIYQPAYIGLHSALAYYRFIPEAVFQTICITTRRNKLIRTPVGEVRYRNIKESLFFGYNAIENGPEHFLISDPEKTILDMLYFLPEAAKIEVIKGLRLNLAQIRERIDPARLKDYAALFNSPKINAAMKLIMEIADVEF